VTSIADWLSQNGLEKYGPLFDEHELTLDVLPHLTESDINQLGLPLGPRRRLLVAIQALTGERQPQRSEPSLPSAPPRYSEPPGHRESHGQRESHGPAERPGSRPPAAPAERRQITVMFCDLVGSTALSTELDPEELRELIQIYRDACGTIAQRYEGHVAQYLGDGLMIYYGWPVAHEDDAERAVRSALEMVRAVTAISAARPLAVRIGLATGRVVVGEASSEDTTEARLAIGEAPNLAARLQSLAKPGEVVIAPATRRLLGDTFALTELGTQTLKGIAEPVPVFRVDAVQRKEGRFEAAHGGVDDLRSLVGREEEVSLLLRRWQRACAGSGQVVMIGGEAGIGKSRLAYAFCERLGKSPQILRYQCSPYHLNSALHPFIGQLESAADFNPDDKDADKLQKLERLFEADPERPPEWTPLLAALLSLPTERYPPLNLTPQRQKDKTLDALAGRIEALARRAPILVAVEDLHWSDPTSQELLDVLLVRLRHLPVLILATHRPEYSVPWVGQAGVTCLTLSRLERDDAERMVAEVAQGCHLPREVLDEILSHSDGVPLFVEELTVSILESGWLKQAGDHYTLEGRLSAGTIPTSLRDSLAARLDRLSGVKEVAQVGACIGREFSHEVLAQVVGLPEAELEAALTRLVGAGLISRRGTPPHATYTFKHALVQDAAYELLLKSRRQQLHAMIAAALATHFPAQVASKPEMLAHHYTLSGDLATAVPLWREAGALAVRRVALREAVAHVRKALDLTEHLPASAARDQLELSIREQLNLASVGLRGWAAPEIGVNAEAILRLAKSQNNAQSLLLGLWWMWTNTITQGRIADSLPWAEGLVSEGSEAEDVDLQIFGFAATAVSRFFLGELNEASAQAERVLALYDPVRAERWIQLTGYDMKTLVEVWACQWIWMLGYPERARELSESSTAHARAVEHAFNLLWALSFGAYAFAFRREPEALLERVREADQLARDQGITFVHEVSVPQISGLAELQRGRAKEASALLRHAIDSWAALGGHVRIPYLKSALAQAVALEGDVPGALLLLDECLEQIERIGFQERVWLAEILRLKGALLLKHGDRSEGEQQLRQALGCARQQEAKSWELRAATTLAALLRETGRREEAYALLAPVYGWFREGTDTKDLAEAKALLDELLR